MWAMVSRAESMPSSVKSQGYVYMVARMGVVSLGTCPVLFLDGVEDHLLQKKTISMRRLALRVMSASFETCRVVPRRNA